jgi:hypothetical protein
VRKDLIDADLIEAVVQLPKDMFYGAGIPACWLILNRLKSRLRRRRVLFIDASDLFERVETKNPTVRSRQAGRPCADACAPSRTAVAPLAQVIVDDRLRDVGAERLDQVADPDARYPRVPGQQRVHLLLERIELRRALRTAKRGRLARAQRHPGTCCAPARCGASALDQDPTHEVLPARLCPALHVEQALLLAPDPDDRARLTTTPDASAPSEARGQSQSAKGGQFSTGADTGKPSRVPTRPHCSVCTSNGATFHDP